MSGFMERYKRRVAKIRRSPEFKREMYMNRLTARYVAIFLVVFGFLAYLTEKIFGISGYITCSIAALAAIALSVSLAGKKTKAKFGEE